MPRIFLFAFLFSNLVTRLYASHLISICHSIAKLISIFISSCQHILFYSVVKCVEYPVVHVQYLLLCEQTKSNNHLLMTDAHINRGNEQFHFKHSSKRDKVNSADLCTYRIFSFVLIYIIRLKQSSFIFLVFFLSSTSSHRIAMIQNASTALPGKISSSSVYQTFCQTQKGEVLHLWQKSFVPSNQKCSKFWAL